MRPGKILIFTILLPLAASAATSTRPAAKKTPAGPDCSFESRFQKLHAIQTDGTYSYADGVRAQLAVRQSILLSIIDCAVENVRKRQSEFKNTPAEFQNTKAAEDIAHGLTDALNYYAYKRSQVPNLGILGTQETAAEISVWRTGTYAPLAARQDDFEVWTQNQSLFDRTDSRLAMINPVVFSLAVLNRDGIQESFADAQGTFNSAKDLNGQAGAALDQGDPRAGTLIKASLASLAAVYKKLQDLSGKVKKISP